MEYRKLKKYDFLSIFLICSLFAAGLFHEFIACFAGVALCIYSCIYIIKNKKVSIYLNLCSLAVSVISLFYFVSTFYALDKGSAIIGFFKFFPVLVFLFIAMQEKKNPEDYLNIIPPTASAMTVVSAILMQIDPLEKWFSVSGRLAGFFQYSNTFALFLLIALIIISTKDNIRKTDFVYIPVLLAGIIYSGSRTVFVLLVVSVIAVIIFSKNKKFKLALSGISAAVIIGAVIFALVTDNFRSIGRFLTMSFTESTFVGRFLYFADALPVILKHPFGIGYMGYYFFQHSVQTGVYTVKFIHNDFLQMMLDIGWAPVLLFVAAIVRSFFRKGATLQKRLLILIISTHTCFDFNFQYVAILMLFVLLLDYKDGKKIEFSINNIINISITSVVSLLFIYIGLTQAFTYFEVYETADKLYPWNTMNHMAILSKKNTPDENLADKIIENNGHLAIGYTTKAKLAYSDGDFEQMIKYQDKAIEVSPFTYKTYEDYCYMLINGIFLYSQNGDTYSAEVCADKLLSVYKKLEQLPEKLSKFGEMIEEQPNTQLPEDIINYIKELKNEK